MTTFRDHEAEMGEQGTMTFAEFARRFADDDACLDYLWRSRFSPDGEHAFCSSCHEVRRFRRYDSKARRRAWSCTACGHYVHPTAGTIFHKSSTPLHLWFLAVYIMVGSEESVSIKQLERTLGVTYKTAWRMAHLIAEQLLATGTTDIGDVSDRRRTRRVTVAEAVRAVSEPAA